MPPTLLHPQGLNPEAVIPRYSESFLKSLKIWVTSAARRNSISGFLQTLQAGSFQEVAHCQRKVRTLGALAAIFEQRVRTLDWLVSQRSHFEQRVRTLVAPADILSTGFVLWALWLPF